MWGADIRRHAQRLFIAPLATAGLSLTPLSFATAQDSSDGATMAGTATRPALAMAARAQPEPPSIDGKLDEAAWQAAPVFSDFIQLDPNEGEPATERTEVRVLYTDAALYRRPTRSRPASRGATSGRLPTGS
jgi:hypothetical protein